MSSAPCPRGGAPGCHSSPPWGCRNGPRHAGAELGAGLAEQKVTARSGQKPNKLALPAPAADDTSIIAIDRFILATRDSGYKGTESAVAELVDNSLQAQARQVHITIALHDVAAEYPLRVAVLDDGGGMDKKTLRQALRFGGSSRFNDRSGLGRFGMGLPNSSLSQARRVEVYSWQRPGAVAFSYLDVDEIAGGGVTEIPEPEPRALPAWAGKPDSPSGTLVVWTRCDRLDHRRVATIARKLAPPLGRVFRYYLWNGVVITINGVPVAPVDPLYLRDGSPEPRARVYGEPLEYDVEVRTAGGPTGDTGKVTVTFSELPVRAWHALSNDEKRQLGISNGAGVSVVRADREIDFGWFFMGGKRRENYDDWWRCEIRFDPVLDEAFGITHTKQQIRPQEYLLEILTPDLENQAKALNGRVRQAHVEVRSAERTVEVERLAAEKDQLLKPLPRPAAAADQDAALDQLKKRHPALRDVPAPAKGGATQYRIVQESVKDTSFFTYAYRDGLLVLVVNPEHPFYKKVYKPLVENETKDNKELRGQLDLLLLGAARAEAAATQKGQREALTQFRKAWSENLATFLLGGVLSPLSPEGRGAGGEGFTPLQALNPSPPTPLPSGERGEDGKPPCPCFAGPRMGRVQRLPFNPTLPADTNAGALFLDFARAIAELTAAEGDRERAAAGTRWRRRVVKAGDRCDAAGRKAFLAAVHLLADLAKQGWEVAVAGDEVEIARAENGAGEDDTRERVRGQLHAERDEQLRQPAAAAFIRSMEARHLFKGRFVSIFSLMRDGRDLAAKLRAAAAAATEDQRLALASDGIQPYLQFIREDERCEWTGLRLVDVWRYFRHTWANPYKSVPGRPIMVLVRDAAAPCHPVVGIAALSSAAVAVTARDEKIGWTPAAVLDEIRRRPTARLAAWLQATVDDAVNEIYKVDFLESGLLTPRAVRQPTPEVIAGLQAKGREEREKHRRFMASGDYKKSEPADKFDEEHWEKEARKHLFCSKRALELAVLLSVRRALRRCFGDRPSKYGLLALVNDGAGRDAVARIVRKAKADRVGTAIADLTVCGAIPPYNEVLGGKLVAMLMAGPEVGAEYRRRYGGLPSVIASSMAGRPVCRAADLVFLGTTSLYGQRPSQYDRIRVPPADGTGPGVRYEYLGRTRGLGTFQFGGPTVAALRDLLAQEEDGRKVNYVFGEGVNPRLRHLRDGLGALGLAADDLLHHGGPRLVYGVELIANTRAYLLGLDRRPRFLLPRTATKEQTQHIARSWAARWLLPHLERPDVLGRVAAHHFTHPVRHGARVRLPDDS